MFTEEIPDDSLFIGVAATVDKLEASLEKVLQAEDRTIFTHLSIVRGADRSARMLLTRGIPGREDVIRVPTSVGARTMARELLKLSDEPTTVYKPSYKDSDLYVKGWEVWQVEVGITVGALVMATWIEISGATRTEPA